MALRDILAAPPMNVLNQSRQLKLTSMVWSIPLASRKLAHCVYMLTQYALGVDYINHHIFLKSHRGQNAIAERKSEARSGALTLTGKEEPFEQFLIKALATGKSWEELIQEHRIEKRFIHIQSLWQHHEYFIIYICDAHYPKEEGLYLAFRCIFRASEEILKKILLVRDSHYYKSRLDAWISKETHEIDRLEDRLLSLLIQSVKREMTLTATLHHLKEHLDFQWINKFCELHWLNFLCFQFQGGSKDKEIFKTCALRRKIMWKKFDRYQKARYNGQVVYRLQKKLSNCLKKCVKFEEYFVDELQVVLLNSIRDKLSWSEVKTKINELFTESTTEADESKENERQNINAENTKKKARLSMSQQTCSDEQSYESLQGRKRDVQRESSARSADTSSSIGQQLDRGKEQMQIFSLIQKAQNCFQSIEQDSFKNMPNDALAHYAASHRKEIEDLAEEKLAHYCQFPEEVESIQHEHTRALMKSILAFEKKAEINESQTTCSSAAQQLRNEETVEEISELLKRQSDQILHKMGLSTKIVPSFELNHCEKRQY